MTARLDAIAEAIEAAIRAEAPGLPEVGRDLSWQALGLDSFGMVALRAAAEQAIGREMTDTEWLSAATPADLIRLADGGEDAARPEAGNGLTIEESVEIGMPEMAMGGLSESWLMRTLGDLHWRLIASALGTTPAAICDSEGKRLVPVFTRIRFASTEPLAAWREGETLRFSASLSRLGASLFFSRVEAAGEAGRRISAELMSSFAARGAEGGNLDLIRGQARIPDGCRATLLEEMPPFGLGYQGKKRSPPDERILARTGYEMMPQYDINGLGMLYCAAYPMIADIAQMRAQGGAAWAMATSAIERDVFYFANADAGDELEWRLHSDPRGDGLDTEASIVRSDGTTIAAISTRKVRL
ncbi:MAG TPA: LnmK family bifunctional acyltransferase/decarboxylase [Allosphingosinicella sp.]